MDFDLTQEQQQILDYGNSIAKKFDRRYWMDCADKHQFPEALYQKVADDGFVGTMVPEEYGGAGQGMVEMAPVLGGPLEQRNSSFELSCRGGNELRIHSETRYDGTKVALSPRCVLRQDPLLLRDHGA